MATGARGGDKRRERVRGEGREGERKGRDGKYCGGP